MIGDANTIGSMIFESYSYAFGYELIVMGIVIILCLAFVMFKLRVPLSATLLISTVLLFGMATMFFPATVFTTMFLLLIIAGFGVVGFVFLRLVK